MPAIPPHICAVILHYGDPSLTERVRRQLLEGASERSGDVRVLDNAAPLPAPDAWVRLPDNRYWAGALQWAVEHFQREEPEITHLWFLNNDLSFATLGPLLKRAEQRLAWIEARLGPVGVYSPSALRNPYHPQMVRDAAHQIRLVRCVDGIAPLFGLRALRHAGGIDAEDNAYGYGVDVVTSLRLSEAGYRVVVDHQLAVRHTYHSTARTLDGFLALAARAEESYLRARLGPDHAERLDALKRDYEDVDRLPLSGS